MPDPQRKYVITQSFTDFMQWCQEADTPPHLAVYVGSPERLKGCSLDPEQIVHYYPLPGGIRAWAIEEALTHVVRPQPKPDAVAPSTDTILFQVDRAIMSILDHPTDFHWVVNRATEAHNLIALSTCYDDLQPPIPAPEEKPPSVLQD